MCMLSLFKELIYCSYVYAVHIGNSSDLLHVNSWAVNYQISNDVNSITIVYHQSPSFRTIVYHQSPSFRTHQSELYSALSPC